MLQKLSNKCCPFELSVHQRILKNMYIMVPTKNIKVHNIVFNIDNNKNVTLASNQHYNDF